MNRTILSTAAIAFLLVTPLAAMQHDKDAKHQCRVEYNAAKKQARKAATHKERVAGVKSAKRNYEECLKKAKM
jgi:hypothetical protein